jgi:hypothetical protein
MVRAIPEIRYPNGGCFLSPTPLVELVREGMGDREATERVAPKFQLEAKVMTRRYPSGQRIGNPVILPGLIDNTV